MDKTGIDLYETYPQYKKEIQALMNAVFQYSHEISEHAYIGIELKIAQLIERTRT